MLDEYQDDIDECAALEDLFDLTATLAEYQYKYGENSLSTLTYELKLAEAVEKNGNYKEAEYHCCRILDSPTIINPQFRITVQSFLGLVLFEDSRPGDATPFLFSALADFIVQFSTSSLKKNLFLWARIQPLYDNFVLKSDLALDLDALGSCIYRMVVRSNFERRYRQNLTSTSNLRICFGTHMFGPQTYRFGKADVPNSTQSLLDRVRG